jgi:hypothetical protein
MVMNLSSCASDVTGSNTPEQLIERFVSLAFNP